MLGLHGEYNEGHLRGAILLPEYEIKSKILDMMPNKEKQIIVYCKSGARGKSAVSTLKQLGYNKVYNIYNGLNNPNINL